ncbi:unannotated protein [freshwater metagenome]|uniref:Unannotated protein n=1 Tax=freshwater metagenome TaxID=449393 RepID=A0A6J7HNY8_9ZZZZ
MIPVTRTFGAHSTASDWVRLSSPALAAPYAAVPGEGRTAETEAILMIAFVRPSCGAACIWKLARWATWSGASRLSLMMDSLNRGEAVAASAGGAPPALLITVSIRPKRSTVASTRAAAASGSLTSAAINPAVRPPAVGSSAGSVRPQVITSAPQSKKRCTITRPIPLVPPVTKTTRPV